MSVEIKYQSLLVRLVESSDRATYEFIGDVDDDFKMERIPVTTLKHVVFKLGAIRNFNSCGIREWMFFVRLFANKKLIFSECSVTMIDQINMIPDSLGNGEIESFHAPYYCDTDGELTQLIEVQSHQASLRLKSAPEFNCSTCGRALQFDALEESYFLFADSLLPKAS